MHLEKLIGELAAEHKCLLFIQTNVKTLRTSKDGSILLTSFSNCRCVDNRKKLFYMIDKKFVEKFLVSFLKIFVIIISGSQTDRKSKTKPEDPSSPCIVEVGSDIGGGCTSSSSPEAPER